MRGLQQCSSGRLLASRALHAEGLVEGTVPRHSFRRDELNMHIWFSLIVLDLTVVFAMLRVEPRASGLLDTPEIPVFIKFIFSTKVSIKVLLGFEI